MTKGMIVCPQPLAVKVGLDVFRDGGNAFDAAVATAFAQGIVDPLMCGIGGWANMTYFTGGNGKPEEISCAARVPKYFPPDFWKDKVVSKDPHGGGYLVEGYDNQAGYRSVNAPGTVACLWEAHRRFGQLPWARVLQGAITLAKEGFPVETYAARGWSGGNEVWPNYVPKAEILGWTPASRAIYLKSDGSPYSSGERLVNHDYGCTLEAIAEGGADALYKGDIAKEIDKDFKKNDGFLCAEDLEEYKADVGLPVRGTYRGYEVFSSSPPGAGVQLIQMLNILEGFDISSMDPSSPDYVDLVGRALQAGAATRSKFIGDPDFQEVPVEKLISKDYAAELREKIKRKEFIPGSLADAPDCPDTTHLCVWDSENNAVSLTHTLGSASGVVTPGLGFMYNNAMHLFNPYPNHPNSIEPKKRRATGRTATIVMKDGKPVIIVGAPGGARIVCAVLHSILNVIDHGMKPAEAVAAPRWQSEGPGLLFLEARIFWNLEEAMKSKGWKRIVKSQDSYDRFFAMAQCIFLSDGKAFGGGDPRSDYGGMGKWPL